MPKKENGTIIKIKDLSFSYDRVKILEDISLEVKEGDFLAIIGPNGGGKTTLLKLMLGLIKPDKGSIIIDKKDTGKIRNLIGYVPQAITFDINFPIKVIEVVLMGRYKGILSKYDSKDYEESKKALKTAGLSEYIDRQIGSLSRGQLQRVLIARAIAGNHKLLLLDEPMSSVDTENQGNIYELMLELNKYMTIIMVTHDIGAISSYIEKIACLNRKLYYHEEKEQAIKKLEDIYQCPIELIAHGIPHRVLKKH